MGLGASTRRANGPKRVTRTGIALVHENEVIYPAAGSAAAAERAIEDASGDVTLHFPVVIEIVGPGAGSSDRLAEDAAREELQRINSLLARG